MNLAYATGAPTALHREAVTYPLALLGFLQSPFAGGPFSPGEEYSLVGTSM